MTWMRLGPTDLVLKGATLALVLAFGGAMAWAKMQGVGLSLGIQSGGAIAALGLTVYLIATFAFANASPRLAALGHGLCALGLAVGLVVSSPVWTQSWEPLAFAAIPVLIAARSLWAAWTGKIPEPSLRGPRKR